MLIRPEEMKYLLKNLPIIKVARDSIESELERHVSNLDSNIYSACMSGTGSGSAIHSAGSTTDKTSKIALQIESSVMSDIKQIQKDISLLAGVVENVDNSFKILSGMQKKILDSRYLTTGDNDSTWRGISIKVKASESNVRKIHENAIKQMIIAAHISIETYNEVMEVMDGRGI